MKQLNEMTQDECLENFPEGKEIAAWGHHWKGAFNNTKCYNLICADVTATDEERDEFMALQIKLSNIKASLKNMPTDVNAETANIYVERCISKQDAISDELISFIKRAKTKYNFPSHVDYDGGQFFIAAWHTDECRKARNA